MLSRLRNLSRFGLRTFFVVVTLFAIGIGWGVREWRIVREREAVGGWMMGQNIISRPTPGSLSIKVVAREPSWIRRLFGEEKVVFWQTWHTLPVSKKDRDRILAAFPEAEVRQWIETPTSKGWIQIDRNSLK